MDIWLVRTVVFGVDTVAAGQCKDYDTVMMAMGILDFSQTFLLAI
jgi:hypothetical protein